MKHFEPERPLTSALVTLIASAVCCGAGLLGPAAHAGDTEKGAEQFRSEILRVARAAGLDVGSGAGPAVGWLTVGTTQQQVNKMVLSRVVVECMGKANGNAQVLHACEDAQVGKPRPKNG